MDLKELSTNTCPECKEELKETDRFCPNCGLNLEDDSIDFRRKKNRLWKVINSGKTAIRVILILSGIGFVIMLIGFSALPSDYAPMYTLALVITIIYLVVYGFLYKLTETRPYEAMLIATILMGISLALEVFTLAIINALISAAFLYYFVNGLKAASALRDLEAKRGIIR